MQPYQLPNISEEQKVIVNNVVQNYSCVVDAVAGSGKTTTMLYIAKEAKKSILLLTYNSKLKLETREKVMKLQLTNIEVHSYHSFGYKYYSTACINDYGIISVIDNKMKPNTPFGYDLILLDEMQDMTPLYYRFVNKIVADSGIPFKNIQLCALGDKYQAIYDFNNADSRFITYTNYLFPQMEAKWIFNTLSYNFRTTIQIADFINKCALRENRIKAVKYGSKPEYIICDTFRAQFIFGILNKFLKVYKCDDIYVLAPSVKNEASPVRTLANYASKCGINVYVPHTDDERIEDDVIANKVCFSTYYQIKGSERKIVLLFNFDDSYFKFYKKDADKNVCPNEMYVALTRACEHMVVFHHYKNGFLEFLNVNEIKKTTTFIEHTKMKVEMQNKSHTINIKITDLTRHIPSVVLNKCMKLLHYKLVRHQTTDIIDIPIKIDQGSTTESVSEITSVAIPAYYQYTKTKKMTIFDKLIMNEELKLPDVNKPSNLLALSNRYCSKESGYNYKLNQIKKYDWLEKKKLRMCVSRLAKHITVNAKYEIPITHVNDKFARCVIGTINCIDTKNVKTMWMFKCVNKITSEHFIQFAVSVYCSTMYKEQKTKHLRALMKQCHTYEDYVNKYKKIISLNYAYRIMNILTHEIYELDYNISGLASVLDILLQTKCRTNNNKCTDQEFVMQMLNLV